MKNWIYTCFLILGLANMSNLIASHSLGSDMSYRCIGPDQYEVTLNIYRDCAGASLGSSETVNWTASCGSGSITVNRLPNYPIDITPVCVTQPSSCGGGSGPFGVEQHTYTAILNLPAGCTNITFSWNLCCRNNAITTLNLPGSQSMHIEAQLDNSVTPCNNSPVFLNPPVGFACDGFPVFFSDGGFDPDGDSLSFSLVDCQNSSATPVNYNAGFSGSNPLTSVSPIHIDSSTGAITFTPVGPQIFVMCVLVEEYRNGVKIGEITRDIQFRILNCTNAAPTATGVDGSSSYEATACANTPICFDIDVADANAGDSITINSNNGLAGSTITTIQDTATGALKGQFCWTPTAADVGKHSFTITLQDDACPIIGTNTYTYDINVAPNPNPPVNAGSNTQICQGQSTTLNASSTATNIQAVWWTPSAGLSNPTSLTTQASPDTTTTYTIYTDHIDGCISTDQVTVSITSAPPAPNVSTDSISVCEGESIVLNATTSATGYYWSNAHGFSSTAQSPIIPNASILDTGRYNLYVIDASGCQSLDTFVYVSVNAPPVAPTIVSNSPLCFGDTLNISSSSHCGQSQWIGPNGNSAGTLGIPSANNVLWTLGSTTNIPSTDPNYLSGSWYMVCIDTLTGCQANSNTINITINTIPNTPLAFNNGPVCIGESVQLSTSALSGASYAWYADSTQTALLSTSQNPTITNIITDSTFYLFVTVNGCTSLAGSTTVNVHAVPTTPSVPADFAVCEGEAIVL
ncbi:MAG: hypothetical protein GY810_05760, partial [Aureispira sp.]|nr:hypothetical protein [Aureispira sp.]